MAAWIAGAIFVTAYAAIASERIDRTLVALLAGFTGVAIGVIDQHTAFAAIDLNSLDRRDRRAAERPAMRDAVIVAAFFGASS